MQAKKCVEMAETEKSRARNANRARNTRGFHTVDVWVYNVVKSYTLSYSPAMGICLV